MAGPGPRAAWLTWPGLVPEQNMGHAQQGAGKLEFLINNEEF